MMGAGGDDCGSIVVPRESDGSVDVVKATFTVPLRVDKH
jgi:hypothetical protein